MKPIVELQKVCLRREQTWLLQDINWTISPGTSVAVLGPNGSGKSTLAKILLSYLWPTSGEVCVLGERFGDTDLHALRKHIRQVQPGSNFDVDPKLSLLEVVLTGVESTLVLRNDPSEEAREQATKILDRVGLSRLSHRRYGHASSGERVRALIGRALITTPKLLILDEPTAGLDLLGRERLLGTIGELRESMNIPDLATLMITHHTEELFTGTSEVLLLREGHAFASGPIDQVLTSSNLTAVYRFPIRVHQESGRYYSLISS